MKTTMKTIMKTPITLLALALLLASAPAQAQNEISLRVSTSWQADSGRAAIDTDNTLVQAEFNYARALMPLPFGQLWAEASWTLGRSQADLFDGTFDSSFFLQSFTIGTRYTLPILYWLVAHVRTGLGLGVARLGIEPGPSANLSGSTNESASAWGAGLSGYLLAGVEVLIPRRWMKRGDSGVTGGIVIEGGLTFSTTYNFSLAPDRDGEKIASPLTGVEVGGFNPSGAVLRIGAVLRF